MPSPTQAVDRTRKGGSIRFEVPVRNSRYTVLLLTLFVCAGAVVSILLALSLAGVWAAAPETPRPPAAARGALLAGLALATGFLAWRLAWSVGGREVFELDAGRLRVRRAIRGISRARDFQMSRVRNLRVGSFRDQPLAYASWGRPFVGKGDAYIVFDYEGRPHFYGRGMDAQEARNVVLALQGATRS